MHYMTLRPHNVVGIPLILAQFPNIPQFRTAGWFCMAVGLTLILLQLLLFHEECAWQCAAVPLEYKKNLQIFKIPENQNCKDVIVKTLLSTNATVIILYPLLHSNMKFLNTIS